MQDAPEAQQVQIRVFRPGDEPAFRALNEQWIRTYFQIEDKDEATFADPQKTILDKGGQILMALRNGEPVGCCALLRTGRDEYEVAKMAVAPAHQGRGVGRTLLRATIVEARRMNARRLYLETNRILEPAIRLYESLGFCHLPAALVKPSPYRRADVFMELMLLSETASQSPLLEG